MQSRGAFCQRAPASAADCQVAAACTSIVGGWRLGWALLGGGPGDGSGWRGAWRRRTAVGTIGTRHLATAGPPPPEGPAGCIPNCLEVLDPSPPFMPCWDPPPPTRHPPCETTHQHAPPPLQTPKILQHGRVSILEQAAPPWQFDMEALSPSHGEARVVASPPQARCLVPLTQTALNGLKAY